MLRIIPATAVLAACALIAPASARADEPVAPAPAAAAAPSILRGALARAWEPSSATTACGGGTGTTRRAQARTSKPWDSVAWLGCPTSRSGPASGTGPPSASACRRIWASAARTTSVHRRRRIHAIRADVHRRDRRLRQRLPLNVRPYAGGGLRVMRTDIGNEFRYGPCGRPASVGSSSGSAERRGSR